MVTERHRVVLERRLEDAQDDWNNQTDTEYADPETLSVYGWSAPATNSTALVSGDNRVVTTVQLLCPERHQLADGDKVTLPYAPAGVFVVQADPMEYNASPFSSWQPGKVVNLKRVTG